jgi:predicted nucleotidyltransferase
VRSEEVVIDGVTVRVSWLADRDAVKLSATDDGGQEFTETIHDYLLARSIDPRAEFRGRLQAFVDRVKVGP